MSEDLIARRNVEKGISRLRVAALPRYEDSGPSSRVRMYQYGDYLDRVGFDITWLPLLTNAYVSQLYSRNSKSVGEVGACYFRRALSLREVRQSSVAWIEKELWPWMPTLLDPGVLGSQVPYVVDYDDAVFHNYDIHANSVLRRLYRDKIDRVMKRAHTVVVGNQYLASRARTAGASRVVIVPSVVDKNTYTPRTAFGEAGVVVGWIGTPASQSMLDPLFPVLSDCLDPHVDRFVTVGARYELPRLVNHEVLAWSESHEVNLVRDFEIGVMPVRNAPFERGKCGYKLIQYMAAGIPVIASPVGVNREIVRHEETGFLAETPADWRAALIALKQSAELRRQMGAAGRRLVEERYCIQVTGPQIAEILHDASRGGS